MLFNSYAFLLAFLPAAVIAYRFVDPYPRLREEDFDEGANDSGQAATAGEG